MSQAISWVCPKCGFTLTSLYQKQLDNNAKEHMRRQTKR